MQTMVEYSSATLEIAHAVAPLIITSCCLGLISTKKADKEQGILVHKKDQLCFGNLVFQENSDQKVTISRVDGNDTVTSVSLTCPCLGYNLGVEMMAYLLEGDILRIYMRWCALCITKIICV